MVSNSAQLDRRTKQHTKFGVSASNGSRDMAQTESWQNRGRKKNKKKKTKVNWMVSNSAQLDRRTKQHTQFGVSASNGSRDMARTKLWQNRGGKKKKKITIELDGKQQCKIRLQDQAVHSIWSLCESRFQRYGTDKILAKKLEKKITK